MLSAFSSNIQNYASWADILGTNRWFFSENFLLLVQRVQKHFHPYAILWHWSLISSNSCSDSQRVSKIEFLSPYLYLSHSDKRGDWAGWSHVGSICSAMFCDSTSVPVYEETPPDLSVPVCCDCCSSLPHQTSPTCNLCQIWHVAFADGKLLSNKCKLPHAQKTHTN